MRAAMLVAVLMLVLPAAPARAQFPLAADLSLGVGPAFLTVNGLRGGAAGAALAATDLSWRRPGGGVWSAGIEGVGVGAPGGSIPEAQRTSAHFVAVTAGAEFSHDRGRRYAMLRAGLARLHAELRPRLDDALADLRRYEGDETAGALDLEIGLRAIPRPGPLGFRIALRSCNAFGSHAHAHAVALLVGFAVRDVSR